MKLQKLVFGGCVAAVGGLSCYTFFYPRNRDIFMTNLQINEADAFTVKKIDHAFLRLQQEENCRSLLKKHLTESVLDKLKYKRTKLGASLYDVIRSGIFNVDANVGVYAPDTESYQTFSLLLDKIIEDYHEFSPSQLHPEVDLGEGKSGDFPPLDLKGKYIISTRIRCCRSIKGYPFNPLLSQDDYLIIQEKVKKALAAIKDNDLKGTYHALHGMTENVQNQLINDNFLFKEDDRHLKHANAYNYWPKGRGIYHNDSKTFMLWVNEEDHLRIISMQEGSDVGQVLDRLIRGIKSLESELMFARDKRLGWLTYCPTNLGSSIRASVNIHLPNLSKRSDFKEICERLNLRVRGIHNKHLEGEGDGIYDISNKECLGITEYQAVKRMYEGIKELIRLEEMQ